MNRLLDPGGTDAPPAAASGGAPSGSGPGFRGGSSSAIPSPSAAAACDDDPKAQHLRHLREPESRFHLHGVRQLQAERVQQ